MPTVEELEEARAAAEEWRDRGLPQWCHEQILKAEGLHMIARGYILPGHGRRVFSQKDAMEELGIEPPRFPWEDP